MASAYWRLVALKSVVTTVGMVIGVAGLGLAARAIDRLAFGLVTHVELAGSGVEGLAVQGGVLQGHDGTGEVGGAVAALQHYFYFR